jgi:hypothetical protein
MPELNVRDGATFLLLTKPPQTGAATWLEEFLKEFRSIEQFLPVGL